LTLTVLTPQFAKHLKPAGADREADAADSAPALSTGEV